MKLSFLTKLLGISILLGMSLSMAAQTHPSGVSFKRLFIDYQTLNGGDFGALKDYTDGFEFAYLKPLSEKFTLNIPIKIGLGSKAGDIKNTSLVGIDAQMLFHPLSNPNNFKPYILAGAGVVHQGRDSINLQVPVGIGLDVKISKNAYFNLQGEYRYSAAENNSNFNYGIGFKYFFGRKMVDTVAVIPYVAPIPVPEPEDTDGDGILNEDDECPTIAGLAAFYGCPDTDSDGIQDSRDDCPLVAGLLEFNGCPDADADGVHDGIDDCPTLPGLKEFNGCPDSDGDGIEDSKDECPSIAGLAQYMGCPDTDEDGIEDRKDKCPLTPGPISNDGCPVIDKADREILTFAMKAVQFQLGKATLVSDSYSVLNQIANIMKKYPDYNISIDGHTDNTGSAEVNNKLSAARAKSCYDYLAERGIPTNRMSFQGFGSSRPIADNSTYSGRTLNRRVEFNLAPNW